MDSDRFNYKTITDNKEYFSAYLIMAQHNAYTVLNEISMETLGKIIDEETPLYKSDLFLALAENKLDDKYLPPQTTEKIIEKLRYHFPFVDPMLQKEMSINKRIDLQPNDCMALFTILLEYLDIFRNYYTHTDHKMYKINESLLRYLRSSFDAAVRKVRTELEVGEEDVSFLRRLEKKRNEKLATEKETFEYKFFDVKNKNISEKGLAYFICLFLEPKYNLLFLKKIKGFKRNDNAKYKLIHHCYKCYSIRLSQPKLSSENDTDSLAMDILNELKRCPLELYNHIDKRDKEKFYYEKTMSEEEIEKSQGKEDNDENVQKMIRKEDRFPYFAFSYIDYQKLFEKLRFQVDLGDYHHTFYEKVTVDNKVRLRSLSKKMKAYGRIQDFSEENQHEAWRKLCKPTHTISAGETESYIAQTDPHYHVNNHLITLASTDNIDNESVFPSIDLEKKEIIPDFFLSTHELLGLLFYNYLLTQKAGKETYPSEKLMFEHREKMYRFFDDILADKLTTCSEEELKQKYNLTKREVPDRLLILLGMKEKMHSHDALQKQKVEQMILETRNLLHRSRNDEQKAKNSKAGNYKKEKIIKGGNYASYLARDMVFLQMAPEEITAQNHKITSLNFQVLQSSLAMYDREKKSLLEIFKKCRFFSEEMPHPFLSKVCMICMENENKNNLVNFYQTYLYERINYLKACRSNLSQCHFFKTKTDAELKELAQKYKEYPINLPRGLFKNAITEYFKTGNGGDVLKEIAEKENTSTSFFIEQYFVNCMNDKPLDYYNFRRTYDVINKLQDDRKMFFKPIASKFYDTQELSQLAEELKKNISAMEKQTHRGDSVRAGQKPQLHYDQMHNLYKQFCENEKVIRTYKAQDMMLFLMGKDLLFKEDSEKIDFRLQNILFDNTYNRNREKGQESQKDILSLPRRYEIKAYGKTIFQENLSPKNYGDFKQFIKDSRLQSLLEWVEKETIERKYLDKELDKYDRVRMAVLEQIHLFEQAMFTKYADELKKRNGTDENYSFSIILDTYQSVHKLEDVDKDFIKEIRNGFARNQYPKKSLFPSHLANLVSQTQITEDIEIIVTRKIKMLGNVLW